MPDRVGSEQRCIQSKRREVSAFASWDRLFTRSRNRGRCIIVRYECTDRKKWEVNCSKFARDLSRQAYTATETVRSKLWLLFWMSEPVVGFCRLAGESGGLRGKIRGSWLQDCVGEAA